MRVIWHGSAVTAQREATDVVGADGAVPAHQFNPVTARLASGRHLTSAYGTHLDNIIKRFNT